MTSYPDFREICGFAEIKGASDDTLNSPRQVGKRTDFRKRLGVCVEVIGIKLVA